MTNLIKVDNSLKPYSEKNRAACPFYGFHLALGKFRSMMDQNGNQCALKISSYSPCQMEMDNQKPSWKDCSFFNTPDNQNLISKMNRIIRVFPDEFWPPGERSWDGIELKDWIKYIEDKNY